MYHNIEDEHIKTSVNFITHPKEKSAKHKPAYVTRYGPKGFVVHGSRVLGSLVILPGLFLHWKVIHHLITICDYLFNVSGARNCLPTTSC